MNVPDAELKAAVLARLDACEATKRELLMLLDEDAKLHLNIQNVVVKLSRQLGLLRSRLCPYKE